MKSMNKAVKIGNVELGNGPRVALAVNDEANWHQIKEAKTQGVNILEVRVDHFKKLEKQYVKDKIKAVKTQGLPIIATIRCKKEGGAEHISDEQRLKLFIEIIPLVDAVDIELKSESIQDEIIKETHSQNKSVIISYHNFVSTPSDADLSALIKKSKEIGGDIVKIATQAEEIRDTIRLLNITQKYKDQNMITISFGKGGSISRVFFPFIGSLITYTCLPFFMPSSIGQIPLKTLLEELRFYYPKFNEELIINQKLMECV